MLGVHHFSSTGIVGSISGHNMNKVRGMRKTHLSHHLTLQYLSLCLLVSSSLAAPTAEADADPQFGFPAPLTVPAPNCVTSNELLVTQSCTPRAENICETQTVETEEIEYEPLCIDVVDVICDAPVAPAHYAHGLGKREAEADPEADAQFFGYAAHAVAHSVKATVKHACREVTTEHCVDNPKIKLVPVEVEHCPTITKVDCTPVENPIPTTKCEAVETTHVSSPYGAYGGYY